MVIHRFTCAQVLCLLLLLCCGSAEIIAQQDSKSQLEKFSNALEYKIRPGSQRISMTVNSSKILTLEGKQIPRALVNNPELLNAIAISANQLQLSGLKTGVTQINLWDEDGELYSIDVIVSGDAKELELLLESEFPNASLKVRQLATSVVLSGWVDEPEVISRVVRMAEDYYPKVINNIRVGDNQQVQLHVQVMEVSRSKLRQMGVDWAWFGSSDFLAQSVSGLIGEVTSNARTIVGTGGSTITFGIASGNSQFFGVIDALRSNDLIKVLAEPVLTTVSGRPAAFNAGGEFPILIPQGLGTVAVEYKTFGTRVDFVPIVLGNGNIRLEVRPQVSEIDNSRGVDINGVRVPGLRNRWVDTAVEMRAGQTLALAGLIQERVEAQNQGIPVLADLPWAGSMFRRVTSVHNEIELLVMVRPEFVAPMNPDEIPVFGPGEQTVLPDDEELYMRGYIEVPNCCPDGSCLKCRAGRGQFSGPNPGMHSNAIGMGGMQSLGVINGEPTPTPAVMGPSSQPMMKSDSTEGLQMPAGMPFGMRPSSKQRAAGAIGTEAVSDGSGQRTATRSRWGGR